MVGGAGGRRGGAADEGRGGEFGYAPVGVRTVCSPSSAGCRPRQGGGRRAAVWPVVCDAVDADCAGDG